jgi:hypothetical protein
LGAAGGALAAAGAFAAAGGLAAFLGAGAGFLAGADLAGALAFGWAFAAGAGFLPAPAAGFFAATFFEMGLVAMFGIYANFRQANKMFPNVSRGFGVLQPPLVSANKG